MRVAVLADIHGNLSALDAVLNDTDAAAVDAIVLNGERLLGRIMDAILDRILWQPGGSGAPRQRRRLRAPRLKLEA